MKKAGEALELNLETQGDEGLADIYLAVKKLPDGPFSFISSDSSATQFTTEPHPYATGITNKNTNHRFEIPKLSRDIPAGKYAFYAVAVPVGANVFNQDAWLSPLAIKEIFFVNNNNTLPVPPLLTGTLNDAGQKVFELNLQRGQKSFLPGTSTETFGINGDYLGPTIRLSKGDKALFKVTNHLGERTTIHWHGAHVPAAMDGGPHQVIEAGETWQPSFEIMQPAATLWYHPHLHGKTGEHVYKGLAGFFIVDDEVSDSLPLPKTYGVDDIPIVIQDRNIDPDGTMNYTINNMENMMGFRGAYILVNGAVTPTLETKAQMIRLRLLNGSNARIYNFGFSDNRTFYQIATDGGLLQTPVPMNRLRLAPGERAEILLDLRQDINNYLILKSYSEETTPSLMRDSMMSRGRMMSDDLDMQTFDVMYIRIGEIGDNGASLPSQLTSIDWLQSATAVRTRTFVLGMGMGMGMGRRFSQSTERHMFTINGQSFDMNRIDETVRLGDTEIWVIRNQSMAHPFHMHDVQFQILDRNGAPPSASEKGWKDTVLVMPNETVRVIARFDDFADPDHAYMYHCHILEHEDDGMMGQFIVVP
ncbi:blue copper oxidase [Methylomarinovum tepidoasis]|uniref:Blue copper oxidase n=2 Tax=Methylomarinovum tepidoasis TaxID=2840183 RepID=A0AAU9CPY2_9GAMM|nr:blue copper oxidase [Methylomarinovum sp. IN45]